MKDQTLQLDTNKISVVLASALIFLVSDNLIPTGYFDSGADLSLFGLLIPLDLGFLYSAMISGLVVVGMLWILSDHPSPTIKKTQHVFLPALFVFILSVALKQLPVSGTFWVILAVGAGLLYLTLVSEFISVDTVDMRFPLASASLQTLAYVIFFIFVSTLSYGNQRLIFQFLFVFIASFAIAERNFHLRTGSWKNVWSLIIAFIVAQLTVGFHYLPLRPYQFGVFSVGILFSLIELTQSMEGEFDQKSLLVPGLILLFFIFIGLLLP